MEKQLRYLVNFITDNQVHRCWDEKVFESREEANSWGKEEMTKRSDVFQPGDYCHVDVMPVEMYVLPDVRISSGDSVLIQYQVEGGITLYVSHRPAYSFARLGAGPGDLCVLTGTSLQEVLVSLISRSSEGANV